VATACTLLIIFQWAVPLLPDHLVWGIHHLAYAPLWARFLWTALALFFLWGSGSGLARLEEGVGRGLGRRLWAPVFLVVAGGIIFWLLRNRTHFMGDGYLVAELVDRGVGFRTYDFFDFFLHATVWKLLQTGEGVSAFSVYAWASILAGVAYVLAVRWISLRLADDWAGRALLFSLLVFCGPLELFFGYVESYSFQIIFVLLYLATAVLALQNKGPLWRPGLFFGLALAFHTTTLFLAPTLLYLAFARLKERGMLRSAGSALLPAAGVVVAAALILISSGYTYRHFEYDVLENRHTRAIFLPLLGSQGLLSLYHLKDLLNLALLLIPVPVILLSSTLIRRPRAFWESHERRFLSIGAAFLLVLLIAVDRKIGGARDWDLFAAHICVLTLLAFLAWRPWAFPAGSRRGHAGFLMVTAVALAGPWFWVNGGEDRSVARFRDIITDFPSFKRAYSHEEIAKHYRNKGELQEAQREYQLCVDTFPGNARFWALLGGMKVSGGDVDGAVLDYKKALEIEPDNATAQQMLIEAYQKQGRAAETLPLFRSILRKQSKDPAIWAWYGIMARDAGEIQTAIEAFENSVALKPTTRMKLDLAVAYGMANRWDEAARGFRELVSDNEVGTRATLGLATALYLRAQKDPDLPAEEKRKMLAESQTLLEKYLQSKPQDEDVRETLEAVKAALGSDLQGAGR
jgi:tetratricopeptide (TPR) repeat protein